MNSHVQGVSLSSTVSSILATVDSQTGKLRDALLDSEARRIQAQEKLSQSERKLLALMERVAEGDAKIVQGREAALERDAAKAKIVALESNLERAHEDLAMLRVSYDESLQLLRNFEKERDGEMMDWRQSMDVLQEENRLLRLSKSNLSISAAAHDDLKRRALELEKQLRAKDADLDEASKRCDLLQCRNEESNASLAQLRASDQKLTTQLTQLDRQLRLAQRELLSEQERSKQLADLAAMYRRRSEFSDQQQIQSSGSNTNTTTQFPAPVDVDKRRGVEEERNILRDDVKQLVLQMTHLRGDLASSLEAQNASLQALNVAEKKLTAVSAAKDEALQKLNAAALAAAAADERATKAEAVNLDLSGRLKDLQDLVSAREHRSGLHVSPRFSQAASPTANRITDEDFASSSRYPPHAPQQATDAGALLQDGSTRKTILILQHDKAKLEQRLLERETEFQTLKQSSLQLVNQIQMLTERSQQAAATSAAAEALAESARYELIAAREQQLLAEFAQTSLHEQIQAETASVVATLSSMANAERLAIVATSEAQTLREEVRAARVEKQNMQLTINRQQDQLTSTIQRAQDSDQRCAEAVTAKIFAEEQLKREQLIRESCEEQLTVAEQSIQILHAVVSIGRQLAVTQNEAFIAANKRLMMLTNESMQEIQFDDMLHYLQASAANVKSIAMACEDVARHSPAFYSTSIILLLKSSTTGPDVVVATGGGGEGGYYSTTARSQQAYPTDSTLKETRSGVMIELSLTEAYKRMEIYAQEAEASKRVFAALATFMGYCMDYRQHFSEMSHQLQLAGEHAANLFRGIKVLSLKHERKRRAGINYNELERVNRLLWDRSVELQELYWNVIDSDIPQEVRDVVRAKLKGMFAIAPPPPPSSLPSSSLTENERAASTSMATAEALPLVNGDIVGQLTYENERLIEETARLAKLISELESRNSYLVEQKVAYQQKIDSLMTTTALMQSSSDVASPARVLSASLETSTGMHRLLAATDAEELASARSTCRHLADQLESKEAAYRFLEANLRKVFQFVDERMETLHHVAYESVLDVCTLSAFKWMSLQQSSRRNSAWDDDDHRVVDPLHYRRSRPPMRDICLQSSSEAIAKSAQTDLDHEGLSNLLFAQENLDHGSEINLAVRREESTRMLLVEQYYTTLVSHLTRSIQQIAVCAQSERDRVSMTLSQAHVVASDGLQSDHKQQLAAFARTIDEYNHRLQDFMKAKATSDQETQRLRRELKSERDATNDLRTAAARKDQELAEVHLRLVDTDEAFRLCQQQRNMLQEQLRAATLHVGVLKNSMDPDAAASISFSTLRKQQQSSSSSVAVQVDLLPALLFSHQSAPSAQQHSSSSLPPPRREVSNLNQPMSQLVTSSSAAARAFTPFMDAIDTFSTGNYNATNSGGRNLDNYGHPADSSTLSSSVTPVRFNSDVSAMLKSSQHEDLMLSSSHPYQVEGTPPTGSTGSSLAQLQHKVVAITQAYEHDLREAKSRGFDSLSMWARANEAVLAELESRQVALSIAEKQQRVVQTEIDMQLRSATRESVSLRFEVKEMKAREATLRVVSKKLLFCRRRLMRQLQAVELGNMINEDEISNASKRRLLRSNVHDTFTQTTEECSCYSSATASVKTMEGGSSQGFLNTRWWPASRK